jgi:hypothetical protein
MAIETSVIVGIIGGLLALLSGLWKRYSERKLDVKLTVTLTDEHGHRRVLENIPVSSAGRSVRSAAEQISEEVKEEQRVKQVAGPVAH